MACGLYFEDDGASLLKLIWQRVREKPELVMPWMYYLSGSLDLGKFLDLINDTHLRALVKRFDKFRSKVREYPATGLGQYLRRPPVGTVGVAYPTVGTDEYWGYITLVASALSEDWKATKEWISNNAKKAMNTKAYKATNDAAVNLADSISETARSKNSHKHLIEGAQTTSKWITTYIDRRAKLMEEVDPGGTKIKFRLPSFLPDMKYVCNETEIPSKVEKWRTSKEDEWVEKKVVCLFVDNGTERVRIAAKTFADAAESFGLSSIGSAGRKLDRPLHAAARTEIPFKENDKFGEYIVRIVEGEFIGIAKKKKKKQNAGASSSGTAGGTAGVRIANGDTRETARGGHTVSSGGQAAGGSNDATNALALGDNSNEAMEHMMIAIKDLYENSNKIIDKADLLNNVSVLVSKLSQEIAEKVPGDLADNIREQSKRLDSQQHTYLTQLNKLEDQIQSLKTNVAEDATIGGAADQMRKALSNVGQKLETDRMAHEVAINSYLEASRSHFEEILRKQEQLSQDEKQKSVKLVDDLLKGITAAQGDLRDGNKELRKMIEQKDKKLEELRDELAKTTGVLEKVKMESKNSNEEHKKALDELRIERARYHERDHADKLRNLLKFNDSVLAEKNSELSRLVETQKKEMNDMIKHLKTMETELSQERNPSRHQFQNEKERDIFELKRVHAEEMKELQQRHEREKQDLKEKTDEMVKQLKMEHRDIINNITRTHDKSLADARKQFDSIIADQKRTIERLEHENAALKKVQDYLQKTIETIKEDHDAEFHKLSDNYEAALRKICEKAGFNYDVLSAYSPSSYFNLKMISALDIAHPGDQGFPYLTAGNVAKAVAKGYNLVEIANNAVERALSRRSGNKLSRIMENVGKAVRVVQIVIAGIAMIVVLWSAWRRTPGADPNGMIYAWVETLRSAVTIAPTAAPTPLPVEVPSGAGAVGKNGNLTLPQAASIYDPDLQFVSSAGGDFILGGARYNVSLKNDLEPKPRRTSSRPTKLGKGGREYGKPKNTSVVPKHADFGMHLYSQALRDEKRFLTPLSLGRFEVAVANIVKQVYHQVDGVENFLKESYKVATDYGLVTTYEANKNVNSGVGTWESGSPQWTPVALLIAAFTALFSGNGAAFIAGDGPRQNIHRVVAQ